MSADLWLLTERIRNSGGAVFLEGESKRIL